MFYLEPFFDLPLPYDHDEEDESNNKSIDKADKKGESRGLLRGFGRIKGALKRNTLLAKKDKEPEKNGDLLKEEKGFDSSSKLLPVLSEMLYDVQIIRKTTTVKVNKRPPSDLDMASSNLLQDVLGIISGLDLDPVQPVVDTIDDAAIPRRLDAIAIQGIAHGSPVDVNQDISIRK